MTSRSSSSSQALGYKSGDTLMRHKEEEKDITNNLNNGELFTMGQPPAGSFSANDSSCQICGDKATGRHYGAISCDGCKGFFRRSIRKKQNYQCRHQKNCNVDKDKRNQCRYCRLQKCIRIGMKQEAVQSERDRISSRPTPPAPAPAPVSTDNSTMLSVILSAEHVFQQASIRSPSSPGFNNEIQEAGVDELLNSMKEQVLLLVQWAKRIPPFMQLAVDDQICLLKAHASEHLLLGVTRRSRNQSYLLLGNNYIVSRQSPENSFALIAGRVLDQLLIAFRNINVDDTEYACLKAIVFFDPYAEGLQAREAVFNLRQEIILALYGYIRNNFNVGNVETPPFCGFLNFRETSSGSHSHSRASSPRIQSKVEPSAPSDMMTEFALVKRFGELLLLVPSVRSIAEDMVDHIKFYKLFGAARVDNVLHELLLGDTAADDNLQPVTAVTTGHSSQPSSYPSSGAATPALCGVPSLGSNNSDLFTQPGIPPSAQAGMSFNTSSDHGFESGMSQNNSAFNSSFSVLEPCMPPPSMSVMTPQHHSLNGSPSVNSPISQSPGLSTLAAAAFVASQSSGGFMSPQSDQYNLTERMESPFLSFAFSSRPILHQSARRSAQQSPVRSTSQSTSSLALKPEQND